VHGPHAKLSRNDSESPDGRLSRVSFRIRKAGDQDAGAVLQCLHVAFAPYENHYTPEGFADTTLTKDTVHQRIAAMTVFVAEEEQAGVIGTIACNAVAGSADEGHIRGMAVLPAWQGHGIADALLAAVEAELRDLKCSRITLDTTAPLQRAIRFYERNGFRASGNVGEFFGMPLYEYVKDLR
jgi:GNAT superfamily N-acetyltransferase